MRRTITSRPLAPETSGTEAPDPLEGDLTSPTGASIPLGDGAQGGFEDGAAPGFDSIPGPDEELPQADADGWYDVTPGDADAPLPANDTSVVTSASELAAIQTAAQRNWLMIGIALMVLISALLAFFVWRRRKREALMLTDDSHGLSLARGVSQTIRNQMDRPVSDIASGKDDSDDHDRDDGEDGESGADHRIAPAQAENGIATAEAEIAPDVEPDIEPSFQPAPVPVPATDPEPPNSLADAPRASPPASIPREPARLDLGLEIVNASRSVMMFSIEFRLDIANRSDHAVRDLALSGALVCAQRSDGMPGPAFGSHPLASLARIGPQQGGRMTGRLQLPLGEVQAIRQGAKPLFIPLLHITLEARDQPAVTRSYVIGSPSASSHGRVHPLPLDGPPGGLPGLRAQLIRQPLGGDAKANEPA